MSKMPTVKLANQLNPSSLQGYLNENIVGQDSAIDELVPYFEVIKAGFIPPKRPMGTFLLLGPSGVGKTSTVEQIALWYSNTAKSLIKIDCSEFQHSHEIAKLLGCFTAETKVLMADGSQKPIVDIKAGDWVITNLGTPGRVQQTYEYDNDSDLLEIYSSGNNTPLRVTPGHEILSIKGHGVKRPTTKSARNPASWYDPEKLKFVPASQLEAGDIVAYPRLKIDPSKYKEVIDLAEYTSGSKTRINEFTISTGASTINRFIRSSDLARLGGYYVSDGGLTGDSGINFTFGFSKKAAQEDLYIQFKKVFGEDVSFGTENRASSNRINLYSSTVHTLFKSLFGHLPEGKKIPEVYLHAPDEVVWDFLDAAYMGDGGRTVPRSLDYSTVSETLASQIEILIRRLGFISQRQLHPPPAKNPHWQARYRLYVSGAQIDRFVPNLRLISQIVDLTNTGNPGIQREGWVDENYVYFKIKSIKSIPYLGAVYDISVADIQSYVTDIVVHNSPPGYLGHRETKPILTQERFEESWTPECRINFILFDEIEKASDALWNLLLGILDRAVLTLGDNRQTDFTKSVIFMTSNVGLREIQKAKRGIGFTESDNSVLNLEQTKRISLAALKKRFPTEFLGRIDVIATYKHLSKEDIFKIIDLELQKINKIIESANFSITISDVAKEWFIAKCSAGEYGARELRRNMEKEILHRVAKIHNNAKIPGQSVIEIDIENDKIVTYRDLA